MVKIQHHFNFHAFLCLSIFQEFYNKLARKKWNRTRLQDSKFDKYLTDAMDGKFGEGEGDEGKHAELRKELYFLEAEERKKELDKTLKVH